MEIIHVQAKETVKHVNGYIVYVLIFQNLIEPIYRKYNIENSRLWNVHAYLYCNTRLFQCMNMSFSFMLFSEIKIFLGAVETDYFTVSNNENTTFEFSLF